jgi:S1-C subfamily serine protease
MHLSGIASGPVDSWNLKMPELQVFGIPVLSSVWSIIDLPSGSAEYDGTVGFEFLKNFNFTVDFERRRVWFENFTGKTGNDPVADVGISGGFRDRTKRVEVWRVTPGSPADAAGVKKGDEILSVGDQDVASTSFRRLDALMEGPVGSKVKVAISRNGVVMRFDLERVYLMNDVQGS